MVTLLEHDVFHEIIKMTQGYLITANKVVYISCFHKESQVMLQFTAQALNTARRSFLKPTAPLVNIQFFLYLCTPTMPFLLARESTGFVKTAFVI
jgi:hypothetical protein